MLTFFVFVVLPLFFVLWLGKQYSAPDLTQYDAPEAPLIVQPGEISAQHGDVLTTLKAFHKNPGIRVQDQRQRMEELFCKAVEADIIPVDVEGIASEWVLAEGADPTKRLLYLHGGAFRVGSPRTHRYITAELSRRAGVAVLAIDYRMQPEFKTTACHEDAQKAYRWILNHGPEGESEAAKLYVAGDSAGGNLTLSVINWAKQSDIRAADAAVTFAPLTDATLSSPTWKSNTATDPFLGPSIGALLKLPRTLMLIGSRLTAGAPPNHPMLSPLLADLSDLPATLIQVSRQEMLYGDAQRYTNKARAAGSEITLQVWPTLVHVFQGFGPDLPEAEDALGRAAEFIRDH